MSSNQFGVGMFLRCKGEEGGGRVVLQRKTDHPNPLCRGLVSGFGGASEAGDDSPISVLERELYHEEFVRFPWDEFMGVVTTYVDCIISCGGKPGTRTDQVWYVAEAPPEVFDAIAAAMMLPGNCLEGAPEVWERERVLRERHMFYPSQYASLRLFDGAARRNREGLVWVFDCDGTLFPTGSVPHTLETLHDHIVTNRVVYSRLRHRVHDHVRFGGRVVICTGRSSSFVIPAMRMMFGFMPYTLIGEGGSEIMEVDVFGRLVQAGERVLLDEEMLASVQDSTRVLPKIRNELMGALVDRFGPHLQDKRVMVTISRPRDVPIEEFFPRVRDAIAEWFPDCIDALHVTHSENAVDITDRGIDKGSAIRSLRCVDHEVWVYFGDAPNDVPGMLACDAVVLVGARYQDALLQATRGHDACFVRAPEPDVFGCLSFLRLLDPRS